MKIKGIKKQNNGKYSLELDNGSRLSIYDDTILKNNLLYKKDINNMDIKKIIIDNNFFVVYNKIVKALSHKDYSEKQILDMLAREDLLEKDRHIIVNKLKDNGILNDERFAKSYFFDRINFSNDGPDKIKKELIEQNIKDETIEIIIANLDDDFLNNKISKFILKRSKAIKGSKYLAKEKITYELLKYGYSRQLIDYNYALLEKSLSDKDNLENEFNKIYQKLLKSEENQDKLFVILKQKLYQKGYSLDDINNLIAQKKNV